MKLNCCLLTLIFLCNFSIAQTNIKYTSQPPAIDGILDEPIWNLSNELVTNTGSNNEAQFGLLWDNNYLYIAVQVTDDILSLNRRQGWYDDGIEICIDPDNSKGSMITTSDLMFIKPVYSYWLQEMNNKPQGILNQFFKTADGYSMEFAIPWNKLNTQASEGKHLGINLAVNDDDDPNYPYNLPSQLYWKGTSNTYRQPDVWEEVTLTTEEVGSNEPAVFLTYPNGGNFLVSNQITELRWQSNAINDLTIEFSTNGGINWSTIASQIDATQGNYQWSVPEIKSDHCLVRVCAASNESVVDESSNEFSISGKLTPVEPLITNSWKNYQFPYDAYYPSGTYGKVSNACGPSCIARMIHYWKFPRRGNDQLSFTDAGGCTWSANFGETIYNYENMPDYLPPTSTEDEYKDVAGLFLHAATSMHDSYGTGTDLANMSYAFSHYFNFKESLSLERNYMTRAQWINALMDELDAGRILLINGMSLETFNWHEGNSIAGHWDHIDGYNEKGEFHVVVGFGEYDGYYDADELAIYSYNLGTLTGLEPETNHQSIRWTDPVADEFFTAGTNSEVSWESENIDLIRLEFSSDNGKNWNEIAHDLVASSGIYQWQVPAVSSNTCKLRVTSQDNINVYATSPVFSIGDYALQLTNPGGFDYLLAGSHYTIQWEETPIEFINIDFSDDDGSSWQSIVENYATSSGSYEWTVPTVNSSQCMIKITATSNPEVFSQNESPFEIGLPNPVGGPYLTDDNTVVLLHFEDDLTNQSALTGNATGTTYTFNENSVEHMGKCIQPGQALVIEHDADLNLTGDWTIEAWVKINSFSSLPSFIINKPGDADPYFSNFSLQNNVYWNNDWFFFYFSGENRIGINTSKPKLNQWYHIAFIRDTQKGKAQMLIHNQNRELVTDLSISIEATQALTNQQDLQIGQNFDGYIDELRISNCVRSFEPPAPPAKPTNPFPTNYASNVSTGSILSWSLGENTSGIHLLFGENNPPTTKVLAEGSALTSYTPADLDYSTTYYWQVIAINNAGETKSEVWSFSTESWESTQPPAQPENPTPENGAGTVSVNQKFEWEVSSNTTAVALYYGTNNPPNTMVNPSETGLTFFQPTQLDYSTTYYWQVVAKNKNGDSESEIWTFTTESWESVQLPGLPANPGPANSATGIDIDTFLSWNLGDYTETVHLYFGTSNPPTQLLIENKAGVTNYQPDQLDYSTTYFWQVIATNKNGNTQGDIWSFSTISWESTQPPGLPSNPNPENGSSAIAIDATLDWDAGSNTTTFDLYFGTTNPPAQKVMEKESVTTSFQPDQMNYSTTYYWQVIAQNENGETNGEVWRFTTEQETGTNMLNKEIPFTWSIDQQTKTIFFASEKPGNISIVNNRGQVVLKLENINHKNIAVDRLVTSLYIFRFETRENVYTRKFIIED